ncbi:MAG: patatin-like phospholipase family protein [Burkholderiaceae bacterium]|nr:patatin-like phospholipase family protein [Burkholderiaceae bacterium]
MKLPRSAGSGFVLLAIALAVAAATTAPALAQTAGADGQRGAAQPGRPKVCLVLSGGGARGAAHVGVIKVLEEYRVPIDCIAGTSMGSLVGGAYATGMSVPDMEVLTGSMSVEKLFKENPPRQELAMRRKSDDYRNYFSPEIGTASGKAALGKGVVTGVQLESVLRELARVQGYFDFDQLPIPFRAVATDLVTGKEVVFREGELANVMRASMSVPGAVAPAEYNGMILVDGMLTSNLPVAAARAMGADIVIAVNVGTPLLKREQLTSIVGVAGQMLSILTEQNVQASLASLKPSDILISPELGDFSTSDFDHLPEIVPKGEAAARQVADKLAGLSLPPAEYAALRKRQQVTMLPDLKPVDAIRFENLKTVNAAAVQGVMQTQAGQPLVQAQLDADMRRLYGTGDFEHVNYRIVEQDGQRVLSIDAVEKAWGPNYLRFGLGLSSDFSGAVQFNLLASHRMTWLNPLGAELRTDVQLGHDNSLRTEFFQPLSTHGGFFVAPRLAFGRDRVDLYSRSERVAIYNVASYAAALDLGYQLEQHGEFRLGLEGGKTQPRLDTGASYIKPNDATYRQGAVRLQALFDRLDSVVFPRDGWTAHAQVYDSQPGLGADFDYTRWQASGHWAFSFGENTVKLAGHFGGKIGANPLPAYDQFQWGGFLRQSGYAPGQLVGASLEFEQLMFYRRIARSGLFEGAYAGVSLETGRVGDPLVPGNPTSRLNSAALYLGIDTLIGPVYFGYGRAQDRSQSLYFFLGNTF